MKERKRLKRSKDGIIGGVCAGLGDYFNIDPVIFRLLWVLGFLMFGIGIIGYLVCWFVIPSE